MPSDTETLKDLIELADQAMADVNAESSSDVYDRREVLAAARGLLGKMSASATISKSLKDNPPTGFKQTSGFQQAWNEETDTPTHRTDSLPCPHCNRAFCNCPANKQPERSAGDAGKQKSHRGHFLEAAGIAKVAMNEVEKLQGLLIEAGRWLEHLKCGTVCQCQGEQNCGLKTIKAQIKEVENGRNRTPAHAAGQQPEVHGETGEKYHIFCPNDGRSYGCNVRVWIDGSELDPILAAAHMRGLIGPRLSAPHAEKQGDQQ